MSIIFFFNACVNAHTISLEESSSVLLLQTLPWNYYNWQEKYSSRVGAGEQMTEQHKENSLEDNHQSIVVIKRPHNQGPESKFLLTITQHYDQL